MRALLRGLLLGAVGLNVAWRLAELARCPNCSGTGFTTLKDAGGDFCACRYGRSRAREWPLLWPERLRADGAHV